MINKALQIKLAILAAVSITLSPALAQVASTAPRAMAPAARDKSSTAPRSDDDSRRHGDRGFHRDSRRGGWDQGGDRRRHDPEAFRQLMNAELDHIPSLDRRMSRLMDIQAQRFELQKQRLVVGRSKGDNRETTIRKFHGLLKQDHHLSDEARKIVQEIAGDMETIQGELDKRRDTLKGELEKAEGGTTDTENSSPEARELRRRMRYLSYLEKKLVDLQTNPERLDLFARVLRGLPQEEPSAPEKVPGRKSSAAATPEERLGELHLKRRVLQHELDEVELEIEELRKRGVGKKQNGECDGNSGNQ